MRNHSQAIAIALPREARAAPSFLAELAECIRIVTAMFDRYHPERHYMRGPGPKFRAKQQTRRA